MEKVCRKVLEISSDIVSKGSCGRRPVSAATRRGKLTDLFEIKRLFSGELETIRLISNDSPLPRVP